MQHGAGLLLTLASIHPNHGWALLLRRRYLTRQSKFRRDRGPGTAKGWKGGESQLSASRSRVGRGWYELVHPWGDEWCCCCAAARGERWRAAGRGEEREWKEEGKGGKERRAVSVSLRGVASEGGEDGAMTRRAKAGGRGGGRKLSFIARRSLL